MVFGKELNIIVKGCFRKHTDCPCKDHDMPIYRHWLDTAIVPASTIIIPDLSQSERGFLKP